MQSISELYKIGFGPSSSHTMGPAKAAKKFLTFFPYADHYEVILYGSLALTGRGHLTDQVLASLFKSENKLLNIVFDFKELNLEHPNTIRFLAFDGNNFILGDQVFYSVGGGNIIQKGEDPQQVKETYPFANFSSIKKYCFDNNLSLPQLAKKFEDPSIMNHIELVFRTMEKALQKGLKSEGFLPGTLHLKRKAQLLLNLEDTFPTRAEKRAQTIMAYAYAISEENAAGGVIVTAPTCGSSGVLPALLYYYHHNLKYPLKSIYEALLVAGIIGVTIKQNGSISGAECGCQAEIGVASAMAASAIAYLHKLSIDQIEYAAEVSLEHHLGLTCDPVDGYVQIPCIERNAINALQVLDSVFLAQYVSYDHRVSLDQMIFTMLETGRDLNVNYRETAQGGMAKIFKK